MTWWKLNTRNVFYLAFQPYFWVILDNIVAGDCILNCNTDKLKAAKPHDRIRWDTLRPDPWLHLGGWWRQLHNLSCNPCANWWLNMKVLNKFYLKLYPIVIKCLWLCEMYVKSCIWLNIIMHKSSWATEQKVLTLKIMCT